MDKVNKWKEELDLLIEIISKAGLTGTIKWGTDVFTHQGKNVVGVAGFKEFFALWFYNGVFLKDEQGVLYNSQEGKTKALRQWRFYAKADINEPLILAYVHEAMQLVEDGKVHKPEKLPEPVIPDLLLQAMEEDNSLKGAFQKLSPYKQRDYIEYVSTAKRLETQQARLEKIKPLILNGLGLNDKYKTC
jgi:uncharacterized protein YdeI (YjbR/CyaY-like superfamily)